MTEGWPEGRNRFYYLFFSMSLNPLLSGCSNISRSLIFFREFGRLCKIHEFGEIHEICELRETRGFHALCSGTGCKLVVAW